jgi:hypothetical protein
MTIDYFLYIVFVYKVIHMLKHNYSNEEKLHQMQYALLTEVIGRWKADVIESFLRVEEIDVVLVQGTVSDLFTPSFSPVKIYVPKAEHSASTQFAENF